MRAHDADRFFSALFAPAETRRYLFALYALNYELARVGEAAREPMIADIRLAWWRETVEGARAGRPRNHDVAKALAETFAAVELPEELFVRMIEARAFDAGPERFPDLAALEDYAAATSGTLMQLAARALGESRDEAAQAAGIAAALGGAARSVAFHAARGKLYLPVDILYDTGITPEAMLAGQGQHARAAVKARLMARAMEHLRKTRGAGNFGAALPALLPAALVSLYAKREDPPLWRKQIVYLAAALKGRL